MTTFDELYNQRIDEGLEREATRFPIAPTASYNIQFTKWEEDEGDNPQFRWTYGKPHFRVGGTIRSNGLEGGAIGYARFRAAPKKYYQDDGRLDPMSDNYGNLVAALRKSEGINADANHGDVKDATLQFPIRVRVLEQYRNTGEERWTTIREGQDDLRAEFLKGGADGRNIVVSIMQYQDR